MVEGGQEEGLGMEVEPVAGEAAVLLVKLEEKVNQRIQEWTRLMEGCTMGEV